MRNTFRAIVSMLLLGATVLLAGCMGGMRSVDVDQAELQRRLAQKFPLSRCAQPNLCVELSEPRVLLTEGSERIGLNLNLAAQLFGRLKLPGTLALSGKLRFAPQEGSLYIDELAIDGFEIAGLPREFTENIRANAPELLRAALAQTPVYQVKSASGDAPARYTLQDVKVVQGKLRISFVVN